MSLRLNTAFTGTEAGAIGEGGGDFFAYSVNNDPVLAEYARPGGLRAVNGKATATDLPARVVLRGARQRRNLGERALGRARAFQGDAVNGSPAAATAETHQLYIDGLALSPPAPTMLDMRDAILLADAARNPAGSSSANFCRIWESFAGRGMGVTALDTADSGHEHGCMPALGRARRVPSRCPRRRQSRVTTRTATTIPESGSVWGAFRIARSE